MKRRPPGRRMREIARTRAQALKQAREGEGKGSLQELFAPYLLSLRQEELATVAGVVGVVRVKLQRLLI